MLTVHPAPSHIGYDASHPDTHYISHSHLNLILTRLFSSYRAHLLHMATTLTSHHTLPPSSSHVHDVTHSMETWSLQDDMTTHTIATPLSSTSSPSMTSRAFKTQSVSSTLSADNSPSRTHVYPPMTIPSHTHTHPCSDCQYEETFELLPRAVTSTSSHSTSTSTSTCSHSKATLSSPSTSTFSPLLSSSKSLDHLSSHRSSLSNIDLFADTREYGIVLADSNQSITHVNQGFTSITGYTCWESVGRKCNFLQGAQTNHDAVRIMRDSLSHNQTCRVGILNYKKNGEPFWNMLTITPLFDAHGSIRHYVGIQVVQSHHVSHIPRPMPLFPWNQTPDAPGASYKQQKLIRSGATIDEEGHIIPPLSSTSTSLQQPKLKPRPISFVAETNLPTDKGMFRVRAYKDLSKGNAVDSEIMCIINGQIENRSDIIIRVHDQCYTSEILGSLKCDCRLQLDYAMKYIQQYEGMVIYMPQEGRGIGLANKIKAYSVQELGYDTVDANRVLGFEDDLREYNVIPSILAELGISSIRLITNNPRKIEQLTDLGIHVTGRVPIIMESNIHSENYIAAKRARMGHHKQ